MQHVIIAIHLMVVTALVVLVLYQKSEGGALGMGGSGFMTGRGQANALTRATGILGTIFFLTSIALTVLPAWERGAQGGDDWTKAVDSKVELKEIKPDAKKEGGSAPGSAGDAKESIFDQLQRAQQQRSTAPAEAPAAAPTPAAPAPAAEAPKADAPALRSTAEPPSAPAEAPKSPEVKAPEVKAPDAPAAEAPKTDAAPKAAEPPKADAPAQWPSPTR